ncbi:MAG TPA: site-2 protease family protein [Candidatus Saccharimonadia bacterium]|nr:site-2 protease family protein [Candidatus Saccharimonadia bacterium]
MYLLWTFLGGLVWLYLSLLLHECAHVVAARMVGFKPLWVRIGMGEREWCFHLLGVQWHVRAWPVGGLTLSAFGGIAGMRWRGAIYALAGPIMDVLLLVGLLSLEGFVESGRHGPPPLVLVAIFIQVTSLIVNLWPHDKRVGDVEAPSDGQQLMRYLSGAALHDLRQGNEAYCIAMRRYDPSFELERCWMFGTEGAIMVRWDEATQFLSAGNIDAGMATFDALLGDPKLIGAERAYLLDAMASVAMKEGNNDVRDKALTWAREASSIAPSAPTVRGTLGAALVQTGHYAEGIEMLTPLTTPENELMDRSFSSAYLAKAWHFMGDPEKAATWLTQARELGGQEEIVDRIAGELSGGASSNTDEAADP